MHAGLENLARLRLRYVKVDGRTAVSKATVFFFSFFPPFSHSVCSDSKVSTRSCSSVEGLFVLRSRDGCFSVKRGKGVLRKLPVGNGKAAMSCSEFPAWTDTVRALFLHPDCWPVQPLSSQRPAGRCRQGTRRRHQWHKPI